MLKTVHAAISYPTRIKFTGPKCKNRIFIHQRAKTYIESPYRTNGVGMSERHFGTDYSKFDLKNVNFTNERADDEWDQV